MHYVLLNKSVRIILSNMAEQLPSESTGADAVGPLLCGDKGQIVQVDPTQQLYIVIGYHLVNCCIPTVSSKELAGTN